MLDGKRSMGNISDYSPGSKKNVYAPERLVIWFILVNKINLKAY